ncbi:MAG: hypothetical protein IJ460_02910 [Clostridia bacterium]|nr:hypothetical protein [Clostridia bacterium]
MLENIYTTKMSANKKQLQNRFSKIRYKNGRISTLAGIAMFVVIIAVIAGISLVVAVRYTDDYIMSEDDFAEYINQPVGSIMADIDYADGEMLVFHYLNGFFVCNQQTYEFEHKIDLSKLNIAPHQQGSFGLDIGIDANGKYAYLSSYGPYEEIKNFDNYIINLDTGKVSVGNMPEDIVLFDKYAQTHEVLPGAEGWFSNNCVVSGDKTYYMTVMESSFSSLLFVTAHSDGLVAYRYVFGDKYVSVSQQKSNMISRVLTDNKEILVNSAISFEIDGKKLVQLKQALPQDISAQLDDVSDGNFEVRTLQVQHGDTSSPYIFVFDNYEPRLIAWGDLESEEFHKEIIQFLNNPVSDLYAKTVKFLEKEFHRVYDSYYDIQSLTVSNWHENGNEATFFYKKTYLNYNREPDKAEYIQEAKKRSNEEYETLYNDYLALKESNYEFKVVDSNDTLELYSNVAPKGTEWVPVKIDDYIISNWR